MTDQISSHYGSEPPTYGKVLLQTTFGDVDVELWPSQSPKAVRNFVQLCLENAYDDCDFFRVIPKFMAQTGDITNNDGTGGESVYEGMNFPLETHPRLSFSHRGIVAMANIEQHSTKDESNGKNDDNSQSISGNGSQFFITLDQCPWLNGKHTIFGKVTGNTIFNVLKLNDCELIDDGSDRPIHTPRILNTEVLLNPFDGLVGRPDRIEQARKKKKEQLKQREKKNTENMNGIMGTSEKINTLEEIIKQKKKERSTFGKRKRKDAMLSFDHNHHSSDSENDDDSHQRSQPGRRILKRQKRRRKLIEARAMIGEQRVDQDILDLESSVAEREALLARIEHKDEQQQLKHNVKNQESDSSAVNDHYNDESDSNNVSAALDSSCALNKEEKLNSNSRIDSVEQNKDDEHSDADVSSLSEDDDDDDGDHHSITEAMKEEYLTKNRRLGKRQESKQTMQELQDFIALLEGDGSSKKTSEENSKEEKYWDSKTGIYTDKARNESKVGSESSLWFLRSKFEAKQRPQDFEMFDADEFVTLDPSRSEAERRELRRRKKMVEQTERTRQRLAKKQHA